MARRIPQDEWPLPTRVICDTPEEVARAIETLPEYGEAVIVEHDGKRVAAIIPMDNLELYQRLFSEEEDRMDNAAADEAISRAGGIEQLIANGVPIEELLQKYGLKHTA
jgi:hypothetical protein